MNDLKEKLDQAGEIYNTYANAPIGALDKWHRLMSRNSYTIAPRKPEPDALDTARHPVSALADYTPSYVITPSGKVTLSLEGIKYSGLCWITDPGHGWLSVPAALVGALDIAGEISRYSYINANGTRVYLEEDCDAGRLLSALPPEFKGIRFGECHSDRPSYVRNMQCFTESRLMETLSCKL